jgi:hypothetical protein
MFFQLLHAMPDSTATPRIYVFFVLQDTIAPETMRCMHVQWVQPVLRVCLVVMTARLVLTIFTRRNQSASGVLQARTKALLPVLAACFASQVITARSRDSQYAPPACLVLLVQTLALFHAHRVRRARTTLAERALQPQHVPHALQAPTAATLVSRLSHPVHPVPPVPTAQARAAHLSLPALRVR